MPNKHNMEGAGHTVNGSTPYIHCNGAYADIVSGQVKIMALFGRERTQQNEELTQLYGQVYEAWENWQNAERYFMFASDPELIDYAIYLVEATRRFYMYMLKKVQEMESRLAVDSTIPSHMLMAAGGQEHARLLGAPKQ